MKKTAILIFMLLILFGGFFVQQKWLAKEKSSSSNQTVLAAFTNTLKPSDAASSVPQNTKSPAQNANLEMPTFASQSYNNCGPATLSMLLSYYGKNLSQEKLAEDLRPFNNPKGGVDDKEVFIQELASYAKLQGLQSLVRPNGNIDLLKKLLASGYPVMVTQWLHPNEDIGHYRIVKGFDDTKKMIYVDDSYLGKNQQYSYDQFMQLWQPFDYTYLLIYPDEKESDVVSILGPDADLNTSYQNAITRANTELKNDPNNVYPNFNIATANYYLGNFTESAKEFEQVENKLPSRMLWYQLEPLYAMQQTGEDQKVLDLSDKIINNGNLAYAELYELKGEIYAKQGKKDLAKEMFEKAIFYNKNYDKPKEELSKM